MIESKLVSRRKAIIHELGLNAIHRDPARKRYLEASLARIENDIQAIFGGYSEAEIAENDFVALGDKREHYLDTSKPKHQDKKASSGDGLTDLKRVQQAGQDARERYERIYGKKP